MAILLSEKNFPNSTCKVSKETNVQDFKKLILYSK